MKIILQHDYIIIITIYELVISDKILGLIATPRVNWHLVTGFDCANDVIYIVLMRWELLYQDYTYFYYYEIILTLPFNHFEML